ncbi:hypothetical protein JOQ06_023719, partial [Pogonophryne albipinna]
SAKSLPTGAELEFFCCLAAALPECQVKLAARLDPSQRYAWEALRFMNEHNANPLNFIHHD